MDFNPQPSERLWRDRVRSFIDAHIGPAAPIYEAQQREGAGQA